MSYCYVLPSNCSNRLINHCILCALWIILCCVRDKFLRINLEKLAIFLFYDNANLNYWLGDSLKVEWWRKKQPFWIDKLNFTFGDNSAVNRENYQIMTKWIILPKKSLNMIPTTNYLLSNYPCMKAWCLEPYSFNFLLQCTK